MKYCFFKSRHISSRYYPWKTDAQLSLKADSCLLPTGIRCVGWDSSSLFLNQSKSWYRRRTEYSGKSNSALVVWKTTGYTQCVAMPLTSELSSKCSTSLVRVKPDKPCKRVLIPKIVQPPWQKDPMAFQAVEKLQYEKWLLGADVLRSIGSSLHVLLLSG